MASVPDAEEFSCLCIIRQADLRSVVIAVRHWIGAIKMTDREKLIDLLCHIPGAEEIADFFIANGVTFRKWVPVTERVPEEYGKYLCNVKSGAFRGCSYRKIMWHDQYGFRDGCIYDEGVTHWMPLPEPPKEE